MSDEVLTVEKGWGIATVTLNRPQRRNSLSPELIEALLEAFTALRDDPEARVIVLTGAGEKAFCAGGDLSGDGVFGGQSPLEGYHHRARFTELFTAMAKVGRPIVARLQGHALGGGFGLAMAADIVIAVEDVTLGAPEINLGLFPMVIMATLTRNIPRKKLTEMILLGERVTAAEAARWGFVNEAVPRDQLDERVQAVVQKLVSKSPATLRLGRDAFYASQDMSFEQALSFLNSQLAINLQAEDVAEGVSAFFAKRPPEFKGR